MAPQTLSTLVQPSGFTKYPNFGIYILPLFLTL